MVTKSSKSFLKWHYILLLPCIPFMTILNCNWLTDSDATLSLVKQEYTGTQLRLDGYYYEQTSVQDYVVVYFFNRNGNVFGGLAVRLNELGSKELDYANGSFYERNKNKKIRWGLFNIESNSIKFETWYPPNGGPLITRTNSGTILNDTTFLITRAWESDGDDYQINDTYHFKQFTPKPDSISPFIQ